VRIGVPREIKDDENRVAITPSGVMALHGQGHEVLVECGAGRGSGIGDEAYERAGATLVATAGETWSRAELVLKV
jgi:alanine dehydrogenase